MDTTYATVTEASDVTDEVLAAAVEVYRGWHTEDVRIRWDDLLDRLDGMELSEGRRLDLGGSLTSPAVRRIKRHVSAYAQSEG